MDKKTLFYTIGSIALAGIILYSIRVKISSTESGSMIDKWAKNHPDARDNEGALKAPLLIVLLSGGAYNPIIFGKSTPLNQ